jgi:penicillin amidase
VEAARQRLLDWDFVLHKDSIAAGIYVAWERRLLQNIEALKIPPPARDFLTIGMKRMIDFLLAPDGAFGDDAIAGRDAFLLQALAQGVADLQQKLGNDQSNWVYGQADYKHALIQHPLSPAVNAQTRARLDLGPVPRGGNGFTVGNTGSSDNQPSGASFRIFVDTRNWDNTLGMNTPGQVGDPEHPLYDNLFELWASDKVFPAFYSRGKIESVLFERLELRP